MRARKRPHKTGLGSSSANNVTNATKNARVAVPTTFWMLDQWVSSCARRGGSQLLPQACITHAWIANVSVAYHFK